MRSARSKGQFIGSLTWIDIATSIVAISILGVGPSIAPGPIHSADAADIAPEGGLTENGQYSESGSTILSAGKSGLPKSRSAVEAVDGENVSGCNVVEVPGGLLEITCGVTSSVEDSKVSPGDEALPDAAAVEQADTELSTWLEANDRQMQEQIEREMIHLQPQPRAR